MSHVMSAGSVQRARDGSHRIFASSRWLVALIWCATGLAAPEAGAQAPVPPPPNDYSLPESWICLPGREDACSEVPLTSTVIAADGTTRQKELANRETDPQIDCIYLYPTASDDPTGNSDMAPGPQETGVAAFQLGPFRDVCRSFAPLYRSITLAGVMGGNPTTPVDRELPYRDVVDAWNYYLAHHNEGRGIVLIGHSQGAGLWARLISEEIDGKPIAQRLVSALLLGVPTVALDQEPYQATRPCRRRNQIGCFIAYSAIRADRPAPSDDSPFGEIGVLHPRVACVNPTLLTGESGELHAYLPVWNAPYGQPWVQTGEEITTLFVSLPGLLTAECVRHGDREYLAVTVHGNPEDPRADDIGGDMVWDGMVMPDWGLHGIDPYLAMGDLVKIVRHQSRVYRRRSHGE